MHGFGLLALIILLAALASCAEAAGPNYAYGPRYGYGVGHEEFYCCGSRFGGFRHFHHFHSHSGFRFHDGFHGGHHR
jgi:hypothetical protein